MQIEIELSLITNILLNFFIIKCTCLSTKSSGKLVFLASLLGAIVALILPIFAISPIANIIIEILLSFALCLIVFDIKKPKNFALCYLLFLGYTCLFGGACYAISSNFGDIPIFIVCLISFAVYIIAKTIISHQNKARALDKFTFKVSLFSSNKVVEEEGFLDSGNVLYDPVTQKPIILITFDVFSKLYSNINYISAYCKQVDTSRLDGGHYVPIKTLASGTSILVFNIKKVQISQGEEVKDFVDVPVGLSFSRFDKSLGRKVLLHREFA